MREVTAQSYVKRVRLLARIGVIGQPEKAEALICSYPASEARRELFLNAYDYYCEFKGYRWTRPKFRIEDKPIFLPLESELDALIANTRNKLSVFLQLLKETGADKHHVALATLALLNTTARTSAITKTKYQNTECSLRRNCHGWTLAQ